MGRIQNNPLADKRRTRTWVKKRGYAKFQKHEEECINKQTSMISIIGCIRC